MPGVKRRLSQFSGFYSVPFYSKTLRLPIENYRGRRIYFVTFCCEKRRQWFATKPEGRWIMERLLKIAATTIFCFTHIV